MTDADSGKSYKLVHGCLKLRKPWPSLMISKCGLRNCPGIQAAEEPLGLLWEGGWGGQEAGFQPILSASTRAALFFFIDYCPSSHFNFWKSLLLLQSRQNKAKTKQTTNNTSQWKSPTDPSAITSWYRWRNRPRGGKIRTKPDLESSLSDPSPNAYSITLRKWYLKFCWKTSL